MIFSISLLIVPFLMFGNMPFQADTKTLAAHEFSLGNRYNDPFVNGVFKDNILLAVNYATKEEIVVKDIDWEEINAPFKQEMTLEPGQTFAFHSDVLPEYSGKVTKTLNARFTAQDGFKSDGYLYGDGVCHLASLLYWVAKDANLETKAPTRHDFAIVPDVPREFGVSIYDNSFTQSSSDKLQNLYIKNNRDKTVVFEFKYDGETLTVSAKEKV